MLYLHFHTHNVQPEALKSLYRSPGYKKNQLVLCKNYVLWWWPSWISDRHKKPKLFRGPSNDYSLTVFFCNFTFYCCLINNLHTSCSCLHNKYKCIVYSLIMQKSFSFNYTIYNVSTM